MWRVTNRTPRRSAGRLSEGTHRVQCHVIIIHADDRVRQRVRRLREGGDNELDGRGLAARLDVAEGRILFDRGLVRAANEPLRRIQCRMRRGVRGGLRCIGDVETARTGEIAGHASGESRSMH